MPDFSKFDVTKFFKREESEPSMGSSYSAPRGSLSVNSLSKISTQLTTLAQGETIATISFWICFLLCANFTADIFALLFEKYLPTPPASTLANRSRNGLSFSGPAAYDVISDRNLFSSKVAKKGADIDLDAEPVLTTLPLQLVGTVIFHNPARSLAAIQDKNENKLYPVRMGDMINENVQILSVEPRKVVFINSNAHRKEFVEIPEDPAVKISANFTRAGPKSDAGIQQADENHFSLSRTEIDSQMANFNQLITQARALPEMRGGQMVGFKVTQIVPNSFYTKIGLQDNDIIEGINGEPIQDAAKAMQLLGDIKNMPNVSMKIERNGKVMERNYDFR